MPGFPLFYSSVTPINRETDVERRVLDGGRDARFAASTQLIPALVEELSVASLELPSVFVPGADGTALVFVVGTRSDHNAFVKRDGSWDGRYVPAYIRRYPFILGEADSQSYVCINGGYQAPEEGAGELLFAEGGANTPYFDNVIAFTNQYAQSAKVSEQFIAKLKELDLFKSITVTFNPANGPAAEFHGLLTVDDVKLTNLPDAEVLSLHRSGFLAAIYFHLLSLQALNVVAGKADNAKAA